MIFVAYNPDGFPVSIVSARNQELAEAYWQGSNTNAQSVRCLENPEHFQPLDQSITGVIPILKTKEIVNPDNVHTKIIKILK